jgi:protein-S-isoprenylcysteine O-methyltransferase Ste14
MPGMDVITPRAAIVAMGIVFFAVGLYHRIRSQQSGERLDRTKEGYFILIGLRLAGLSTIVLTVALVSNPARFPWAALALPGWVRWCGVICFGLAELWLVWMFRSLGLNITDTAVARAGATFVDTGPYRYVRNPMYTGVLMLGLSLGLALNTWLLPLTCSLVFTFMAIRTPIEERYLIERFGERYREYMQRTGRFLPRP